MKRRQVSHHVDRRPGISASLQGQHEYRNGNPNKLVAGTHAHWRLYAGSLATGRILADRIVNPTDQVGRKVGRTGLAARHIGCDLV